MLIKLLEWLVRLFKPSSPSVKTEEIEYIPLPIEVKPEPMKTNKEKLLEFAQEALDTDITPQDEVADEVACSQCVCTLIRKVYPDFPILPSTADLFRKLKDDKRFTATLNPERGAIIVSPRTATVNGHTGIFLTDTRIASNESANGLWRGNYDYNEWILTFRNKRGLRIYLFTLST